jgi:hypothetical protein
VFGVWISGKVDTRGHEENIRDSKHCGDDYIRRENLKYGEPASDGRSIVLIEQHNA